MRISLVAQLEKASLFRKYSTGVAVNYHSVRNFTPVPFLAFCTDEQQKNSETDSLATGPSDSSLTDVNVARVKISELIELCTQYWKLKKWLNRHGNDDSSIPVKYVARKMARFLEENGMTMEDLTSKPFDSGYPIEVIDRVEAPLNEQFPEPIIKEMLVPLVFWRGQRVNFGQVVVQSSRTTPIARLPYQSESEG